MPHVAVRCESLFHDEVEGGESVVVLDRVVDSRDELDELLARGVDLHGRCYCGHVTAVTASNAQLVDEHSG